MSTSGAPAQPARARGLIAGGFASFAVAGALQALYGPSVPVLARIHDVLPSQAGAIVGAHAAGGLAALLLAMTVAGIGARQALLAVAAGAAMMAVAPSLPVALAGAGLVGAGSALNSSVFNRRFLAELGGSGARMLGILNAVFAIGAVAAPLAFVAAGARLGPTYGALAVTALGLTALARGEAPAAPERKLPIRALLRRPAIFAVGGLGVGMELSLQGFGPAALQAGGMGEGAAALWASAFFAAFLAARLALWWLADRIAPMRLLAAALAFGAAACAVAATGGPLAGPAYVASGAAVALLFPAYFVAAVRRLGTGERMSALVIAAGYLGATIVPAALAPLLAGVGVGRLFAAMAVYGAVAAALALAARAGDGPLGGPASGG